MLSWPQQPTTLDICIWIDINAKGSLRYIVGKSDCVVNAMAKKYVCLFLFAWSKLTALSTCTLAKSMPWHRPM